jgi:hypothetical protein
VGESGTVGKVAAWQFRPMKDGFIIRYFINDALRDDVLDGIRLICGVPFPTECFAANEGIAACSRHACGFGSWRAG